MRNIHFEDTASIRLPQKLQQQRLNRVIQEELTAMQRQVLLAYYFQGQTLPEIAAQRGVNKSTVCRTLQRAEKKLQKFLKY